MKPLSPNLKYILPKIKKAPRILLFLDYDGTLTPIVKRPEKALLSSRTKLILKKLSDNKDIVISIVSGRALRRVKKLVGLSNIYYAGNHGLEIEFGKRSSLILEAKKSLAIMNRLRKILKKELKAIKDVEIEYKGVTISVHYRRVDNAEIPRLRKIVAEITRPYVKSKKIKVAGGKKVIEIRPPVKWDKGRYCLYLLNKLAGKRRRLLPIYIGDDITDEDAFRVLRKRGITIFVKGEKKNSFAEYYVNSTQEVVDFLTRVSS